jgi:hypothetical protein
MTLNKIKQMFVPGDRWQVQREAKDLTIRGNLGNTLLPARNCDEPRTIVAVRTRCLVSLRPNGKEIDTDWPKATEIIEAREGFLKICYAGWGTVVTLTKAV